MEYWRAEQAIRDTFKIDQLIAKRREEIITPYREQDENTGGGKSSKIHPTEELLPIKLAEDPLLNLYEHYKKVIPPAYNSLSGIEMKVIYLYYTNPKGNKTKWADVRQETNIPSSVCRNICQSFVEKISSIL